MLLFTIGPFIREKIIRGLLWPRLNYIRGELKGTIYTSAAYIRWELLV